MNTSEIQCCINCDFDLRGRVNVCAADQLPDAINKLPCGFIVNTDVHSKPGRHWCAIFLDEKGNGEFFDSLGMQPNHYSYFFSHFLRKHCSGNITFNSKRIQSDFSNICGFYCLFFLHQRLHHIRMPEILKIFSTSYLSVNDIFLYHIIMRIFPYCSEVECVSYQICKPFVS